MHEVPRSYQNSGIWENPEKEFRQPLSVHGVAITFSRKSSSGRAHRLAWKFSFALSAKSAAAMT